MDHLAHSANDETAHASAVDVLRAAISVGDDAPLRAHITAAHPADFADQLEQLLAEERAALMERMPEIFTPDILAELEDEVLEAVLPHLDTGQIQTAITELDSDDALQIAEELDEAQRAEVLAGLPAEDRRELEASFAFDEETAGRLMQREFVAAPQFWTAGQTIDRIRHQAENDEADLPELFFNIYIIDALFRPIGYVAVSKLMRTARAVPLSDIMSDLASTIPQTMDQEDIAYQFEKYHLISAPVVDDTGRLVGMITVDDIVDIIQDENKEDMLALAGVSDAGLTDTALSTVKARAPWLFINLLTAILASGVIALFDTAISKYVALAILMPIIASMGGNAGTQALAVAVRGLTERDLTRANAVAAVRREAGAAVINGIIFAILLALVALAWFKNPQLAIVVFIAMIINHISAGLAGILIPLGLKKAGADPAVASSVFVTTVTDIVGFFAFLATAVLLLP